jgi:hypothetical protein
VTKYKTIWKEKYKDALVGVTTTSLYGKAKANTLSQYDGLKYCESHFYDDLIYMNWEECKNHFLGQVGR